MNPLIALQGKSFDPVGVQGQVNQNRLTALAADKGAFDMQQQQDAAARQQQMRNMLMGLPDNAAPEQVNQMLLRSGNPEAAANYTKTMREAASAQAQAGKANREAESFSRDQAVKAVTTMAQKYQAHLNDPNATPESLSNEIIGLYAQGVVPRAAAERELQELQKLDPATFKQFLRNRAQAGMSLVEQINSTKPTYETMDLGGVKRTVARYPDGRVEVVRDDKVSVSPNTAATNSTQVQTTAMQTGSREKVAGLEIDARASEGDKNREAQAAKDKPLTDSQSKALLFGARAQEANKLLEELARSGVDRPGNIHAGATSVPMIGGALGAATNWTQSTGQQKVEQARRDFINAVMRRESGAVISESEFANAEKQYFPQIGDDDATKEQKRKSRELAIQGIIAEVPETKRSAHGNSVATSAKSAPVAPASGGKKRPLSSLLD